MTRLVWVAIVAVFKIHSVLVQGQASYKVDLQLAVKDKALYGHTFLNLTQTPILHCFEHCVKHCLCTAFHICENTECQLLSSNQFLSPSALRRKRGCTYYDLLPRQLSQNNNQPHGNSCMDIVECCKTSNPCLNGGTCSLPSPSSENRFRCKCADGYKGERCEDMCEPGYKGQFCNQSIRSCRGYGKRSRVPGEYTVLDVNYKPFKVFCDFDNTSSLTWTLIQSYQFKNNKNVKWLPLWKNVPQNQNSPSWSYYRLSHSRMKSIQVDSTKWRLTCRYDTDGVVYTDYARGLNVEVDITSQNSGCNKMEYINVRGQHCTDCTASMFQEKTILHVESYFTSACDFKPSGSRLCSRKYGEDSFGYFTSPNNQHRCSSSGDATSQTWFGGNE